MIYPSIKEVLKDLLECEQADNIEILQDDRLAFNVFDIELGRYLRISKKPMSRSHLESIIHKDPAITDNLWPGIKWIADVLCQTDPRLLMFLRHIFVVKTEEAFLEMVERYDCDYDMVPDGLVPDVDGSLCVGMYWHHESAVIVNWQVLKDCAEEIAMDAIGDEKREARIGLISTLIHELRHMTAMAPWYYGKPIDASEEAVEAYARYETDRLIAKNIL